MSGGRPDDHWVETIAYTLFAASAMGLVSYLCYFNPVIYTRLVNEDQWGEYGTAVAFGIAGALFLFIATKPGPSLRRLQWTLIGLVMLFIAGEELSWGQRILHYSSPEVFKRMNTQSELNLHNFADVDLLLNRSGLLRQTVSLLILGWSAFSLVISLFAPRQIGRMEGIGLPLIPVRLLPIFLLVPYLFMARPLLRSDEIGELFLAVGMAAWAVDSCFRHALPNTPRHGRAVLIMLGVFLAGALLSTALTMKFPGSLKGALESMAHRYPGMGMYDQADLIYVHIYSHPRLLRPETRINHAKMLLGLGQEERAFQVLREALEELAEGPGSREGMGEFLRRRGTVHALLGEADLAKTDFAEAIIIERREAERASDPDEKAEWLWSVAQTLESSGDLAGALSVAGEAGKVAVSGKTQRKVEEWIRFLKDPIAAQAQLEL